jgi:hypothetical protein
MGYVPADIYVGGRRIGGAYLEDGDRLTETVSRASTAAGRLTPRSECTHEDVAAGFAYTEWYDEHWPIRMCRDCRSIIAGREPYPGRRSRRAWEFEPEDVIAAQWTKQWPKHGRPRRKRPPTSTKWPEAA